MLQKYEAGQTKNGSTQVFKHLFSFSFRAIKFFKYIGKNQNFVGGIKRQSYRVNQSAIDTDFDNGLLKDCNSDCIITIGVIQFVEDEDDKNFKKENASVISASRKINDQISDDEADFKKTNVNLLT